MMTMKFSTILILLAAICAFSCTSVDDDELWLETKELNDGTTIHVYHSAKHNNERPTIVSTVKKINFRKLKSDIYDSCISENEAKMLNAISNYNIKEYIDNAWIFEEGKTYEEYCSLLDTTDRTYNTPYSITKEGELIKHERHFSSH